MSRGGRAWNEDEGDDEDGKKGEGPDKDAQKPQWHGLGLTIRQSGTDMVSQPLKGGGHDMKVNVRDIRITEGERAFVRLEIADDVRDDAHGDEDSPVQDIGEDDLEGHAVLPKSHSVTL